jgi:hypothetical protein
VTPHWTPIKYITEQLGETAYLCGVSDGRGKICGWSIDIVDGVEETDDGDPILRCPKHGRVVCDEREFVAATSPGPGRRSAVYFHALPRS